MDDILRQMQDSLVQLQMLGTNFDNEIISSNEDITDEDINKEKRLYLDRKN